MYIYIELQGRGLSGPVTFGMARPGKYLLQAYLNSGAHTCPEQRKFRRATTSSKHSSYCSSQA